MNEPNDEFDPRLAQLFRQEHAHLPAEPFSTATLRAIAAARQRAGPCHRSRDSMRLSRELPVYSPLDLGALGAGLRAMAAGVVWIAALLAMPTSLPPGLPALERSVMCRAAARSV